MVHTHHYKVGAGAISEIPSMAISGPYMSNVALYGSLSHESVPMTMNFVKWPLEKEELRPRGPPHALASRYCALAG